MSDNLEKSPSAEADRDPVSADVAETAWPARAIPDASGPVAIGDHNQIDLPRIPPSPMDKLSSGEVVKILQSSLANLDSHDQRRSEVAVDQVQKREDADKQRIYVGGSLAALGLALVGILAWLGERDVAMMLVVFLATVVGVTIGGNKGR